MRTIAVLNQKGGVGKTTTVANISAALAEAGSKVVVIDFDPQAHLTIHLGLEPQVVQFGSYKVMTSSADFEKNILLMRPNLWLLPSNINLVGAESELVSVVGRETILREALQSSMDKFDYCFIDCSPSLGLLTLNALAAAEDVLIPLLPHFLALQGLGKLLQTIELVNKRINPDLKVQWILLCMFDGRASLPNEVRDDIEQFLDKARGAACPWAQARILPVHIRRNIKLAEAPSYGKTIFEYEPGCNGAEDYRKVAELIHAQFQRPAAPDISQPDSQLEEAPPDILQPDSQAAPKSPVIIQPDVREPPKSPVIIQPGAQKPPKSPIIIQPGVQAPSKSPIILQSDFEARPKPSIQSGEADEEHAQPPRLGEARRSPAIEIKSISTGGQQVKADSGAKSSKLVETPTNKEQAESE